MQLYVIQSSSAGNGYLLTASSGETLLIEAGTRIRKFTRALAQLPKEAKVIACLVSHEHGDHARSVADLAMRAVPVYASAGTLPHLHHLQGYTTFYRALPECKQVQIGGFKVIGFPVQHDAANPFGFLIHHPEMGTLLFATDTYYLRYKFPGLNHILIECNYHTDILQANYKSGDIPHCRYQRTLQSHMSYAQLLSTLQANDLTHVENILLLHLSGANSDADEFVRGVKELAPNAHVEVATPGLSLTLATTPY